MIENFVIVRFLTFVSIIWTNAYLNKRGTCNALLSKANFLAFIKSLPPTCGTERLSIDCNHEITQAWVEEVEATLTEQNYDTKYILFNLKPLFLVSNRNRYLWLQKRFKSVKVATQ